jgi:hypothetical protein
LRPWEFDRLTPREFQRRVRAEVRRHARRADERAWVVAHLMAATGNLPKGTRVDALMRDLLGREPGTVPGQDAAGRRRHLSADQSVEYLAAWVRAHGGKDARPGVAATEGAGG